MKVECQSKMADTEFQFLSQPESQGEGSQSISESTGEGNTEPRLMITKIVCENFKSYVGVKELGPFHKVHFCITSSIIDNTAIVFFYGILMSE